MGSLTKLTKQIEESEQEAVVELESVVLKAFNADTVSEGLEIVGNLDNWENMFSSFKYKPETSETCQHHLGQWRNV